MKIAILGYGTVGSGVGEIITKQKTQALQGIEIAYILEKTKNLHKSPLMCDDIEKIVNDKSVEVVVETMGGIEPAHSFILKALSAGKHVVSANKAVIAKYLKEFHDCANAHGVKFLYEASCGGGIPWIHNIWNVKRIDEIDEIHGIFNGTSNYILDHMAKEHAPFADVLKRAQDLGYAEKDPSADIDGYDIENKLKISASIAFDCDVLQDFPTFGIRNVRKEDMEYAASMHKTIKLMASAKRKGTHCYAVVEPVLYDLSYMEAAIPENFNLTCLHGTTIGDLKFYGQGAGKLPTAHAVVQDIIDIKEGIIQPTIHPEQSFVYDASLMSAPYMLRTTLTESDVKQILQDAIASVTEYQGLLYVTCKEITTAQMHQYANAICKLDSKAFLARIHQEAV